MYNMVKLENEILKNNGGTYNAQLENANLKTGFMVSITGFEYVTHDIKDATAKMVEYTEIVANKKGYYIGAWVDTENDGAIYIDISKRLESKREAEKTARKNKQLAIFDIKKLESIYLDYEVVYYSLYKNIRNATGEIINQVFIKGYDSTNEIPSNYRNDKNNYFILKDFISIKELAN